MLYPRPSVRPERFRLNIYSPLYQGLYFAFLGGPPSLKTSESIPEHGPRRMVGWYNNYPGYDYVFSPYLKRSSLRANVNNQYVMYGPSSQLFASNTLSIGLFHDSLDTGDTTWNVPFSIQHSVSKQVTRVLFLRPRRGWGGVSAFNFAIGFQNPANASEAGVPIIPASQYGTNKWFYSSFSSILFPDGNITITTYNNGVKYITNTINMPTSVSDSWNIALCSDAYLGETRNVHWNGYVADVMIWTRILSDSEHAALADPDNVDLRVPGGPPLILHERTFWPGFSFKAPQVFSRRSRSSRAGSRSSLV